MQGADATAALREQHLELITEPTSTGGRSLRDALRARSGVVRAGEAQGASELMDCGPLRTKQVILIRHGRSTWNEFLGQHKQRQSEEKEQKRSGLRGALRHMVRGPRGNGEGSRGMEDQRGCDPFAEQDGDGSGSPHVAGSESSSCRKAHSSARPPSAGPPREKSAAPGSGRPPSAGPPREKGTFWQGVRGGVRKVGNAITHAKAFANQVDHPLSPAGLLQARALREAILGLAAGPPPTDGGGGAALLGCKTWYVSPFLRALQTAAYSLDALRRLHPSIKMLVVADAREIVKTNLSLDCQGKKGNVGVKVVARALAKVAEAVDEVESEDPTDRHTANRQAELAGISAVLCAMDLHEVSQEWWTDVRQFKKEDLRKEDDRIRRLVQRLLREPEPQVGVVAHSLLFQKMIQLFLPRDPSIQEKIRTAMRNGAPETTRDPLNDKIMNCGTLVLTWRYREGEAGLPDIKTTEISGAEFLFDGHMESALPPSETLGLEPQDLEDLQDFLMTADEGLEI